MKIHQLTTDEALRSLQSGPAGLSTDQAARRLVEFGPNQVVRARHESVLWQFFKEFIHFLVLILWLAAGLDYWAQLEDPGHATDVNATQRVSWGYVKRLLEGKCMSTTLRYRRFGVVRYRGS